MRQSPRVDLHSHTTRSDGATPPRDLVGLAREAEIDVLAVTDHDTVEGVEECLAAGREFGVRVLPGIEMSSRAEGRDVHVLGIGIDHRSSDLQERLSELHRQRRERVGRICEKLAGLGVTLDPAAVLAQAGGKSVGRKHVARALVKQGTVPSIDEAFNRYLAEGSPANIPANELGAAEAAALIVRHGGMAVLAHPGFLDDDALVERILDAAPRIRGIEVYHRYDSPRKHLRYLEVARRRNLLVTGGSDFHGDEHPHNAGLGAFLTPPADWKVLEMRLPGL